MQESWSCRTDPHWLQLAERGERISFCSKCLRIDADWNQEIYFRRKSDPGLLYDFDESDNLQRLALAPRKALRIPRENSPRRMKENETEEGKPWRWNPRIVCKETSEQPFRPSLYSQPRMRRRRLWLFRKCFNDRLLTIAYNRFFIFPSTYQLAHKFHTKCVCPTWLFTRHSLRIERNLRYI